MCLSTTSPSALIFYQKHLSSWAGNKSNYSKTKSLPFRSNISTCVKQQREACSYFLLTKTQMCVVWLALTCVDAQTCFGTSVNKCLGEGEPWPCRCGLRLLSVCSTLVMWPCCLLSSAFLLYIYIYLLFNILFLCAWRSHILHMSLCGHWHKGKTNTAEQRSC